MTGRDLIRWVLLSFIGGCIGVCAYALAAWLRNTLSAYVARHTARRRRHLTANERRRQQWLSAHIRAHANHVIARDETTVFLAMEDELADWQRDRRARDVYDQEEEEW